MPITPNKWFKQAKSLIHGFAIQVGDWRQADADTIRGAISGVSPYTGNVRKDVAARTVFNISSAHVPAFAASGAGYENRYEVRIRLGQKPPAGGPDARELIDRVLASLLGVPADWEKLYYGAVELNGSGIRYYGDVCLVLKETAADTAVLNRNSFDLICMPLRLKTYVGPGRTWDAIAAETETDKIAGHWEPDLADMAVCKVLKAHVQDDRRITIGAVSEGVLADEDYLEVIRTSSFAVGDVHEARLASADAAVDGLVGDRLRRGPTPAWAELLWRHRRRKAEQALAASGVRTRVVVSSGRIRS